MALISDQEWQIAEVADAGLLALTVVSVALAAGVFAVCAALAVEGLTGALRSLRTASKGSRELVKPSVP